MSSDRHDFIVGLKDQTSSGLKSIEGNLKKAKTQSNSLKESMEKLSASAKKMSIGLGVVAVAVGAVGKKMISLASDAEETQSKFNVVFRGMEEQANNWAETFARSVGRSRTEIKGFSAGIADVLKPMGFQTEAAADLSQKMTQLALDVASFNNRQDADVIHSFTSALTGERESLKTLGIVISEADVQNEAYRLGVAKVGEELSKEAKALATANLLFENSKDAQGDLIRTQDSFANQMKATRAAVADLSESIGQQLVPMVKPIVKFIADLARKFDEMSPKMKRIAAIVIAGTVAFAGLGAIITGIIALLPGFTVLVAGIGTVLSALMGPIGLVGAGIAALFVAWNKNWLGIRDLTQKVWSGIKEVVADGVNQTKRFMALGWKDKLKVIAIGAKGAVKLWNAMMKDIATNLVVFWKKVFKGFGELIKRISDLDWGQIWVNLAESAKRILKQVGEAVVNWGKNIWKRVKNIFTGGEDTGAIEIDIPEISKRSVEQMKDTFSDIFGEDEFGFKNTREAMKNIGTEIDTVLKKSDKLLESRRQQKQLEDLSGLEPATIDPTGFDASAFASDFNINSSGMASGASSAAKAAEKTKEAIKKLGESYSTTYLKAKDELKALEKAHADNTFKIKENIDKIKTALSELEEAYKNTIANLDQSLGTQVIEQEAKIKELKEQLKGTEDQKERQGIQEQLRKEEQALKEFMNNSQDLEDEIAEARRRAALTDFERFVEDIEKKRVAETAEFERKQSQLQDQLAKEEENLAVEEGIYMKKRNMYLNTLDTFETMVDGVGTGLATMRKNTEMTVEDMKIKLNELKRTLQEIKALTAPKEGPDRRTLADVGRAFGATDPTSHEGGGVFDPRPRAFGGTVREGELYRVGERGPEFFRPSRNGVIERPSSQGSSSVTLQVIIKDNHIASSPLVDELLDKAEKMLFRKVQLYQKGISR